MNEAAGQAAHYILLEHGSKCFISVYTENH